MGDFYYVPATCDRICKDGMKYTGHKDADNEEQFVELVDEPYGFAEVVQEHMTHENAMARSRIAMSGLHN